MKVLIFDKDTRVVELLKLKLVSELGLTTIKTCNDFNFFQSLYTSVFFDFIFFDVHSVQNKIEHVVSTLMHCGTRVILLGESNYDIQLAKQLNPLDFLLKPILNEQLQLLMWRLQKNAITVSAGEDRDVLFKIKKSSLLKLNLREINYIQALANYVVINYNSDERIVVHSSMKGIEAKLSFRNFIRVHNSYIVRIDKIRGIEGNKVMINNNSIPVSKSFWKILTNKLETI
jgi:DNA-binding LytR/AlgR family response regulator